MEGVCVGMVVCSFQTWTPAIAWSVPPGGIRLEESHSELRPSFHFIFFFYSYLAFQSARVLCEGIT